MKFPQCRLLYWSYSDHTFQDVPSHRHSYFQIEICVCGFIDLQSGNRQFRLNAGDWVLIPPETEHAMSYAPDNMEYYSLKFSVNDLPGTVAPEPIFQSNGVLSSWVISSLKNQGSWNYNYMPIDENRKILELLLLSMLHEALVPVPDTAPMPEILQKLSALVAEEGAKINIKTASEILNISPNQLKYRAVAALEEYSPGTGVKEFIDQQLLKNIDRLLFYSEQSLSRIAEQMKFNNIYTFSRFVHRLTGQSPSQRRKQS